MNDDLFDRLLYRSESDSLDFKSMQYAFVGKVSDEVKSELLKDVLAMVNSWRQEPGFILIGVTESNDKPNKMNGIATHIDDATLQQFINSKVNTRCVFAYQTYTRNSLTFGVLEIPVQKRPVYLVKSYGKLHKETVYVRRGSSTSIAKPDEISEMGKTYQEHRPSIDIEFYDRNSGKTLGSALQVRTMKIVISDEIPDYSEAVNIHGILIGQAVRKEYYRELIKYLNFKSSYVPVNLALANNGSMEAVNIKVEVEIPNQNLMFKLDGQEPEKPDKTLLWELTTLNITPLGSDYLIDKYDDRVILYDTIDRLHAKRKLDLTGTIYICVNEDSIVHLKTCIYHDGQVAPIEKELELHIKCNVSRLSWREYKEECKTKK